MTKKKFEKPYANVLRIDTDVITSSGPKIWEYKGYRFYLSESGTIQSAGVATFLAATIIDDPTGGSLIGFMQMSCGA